MLKTMIKGGILGAVILFLWSSLSWMVLPWHNTTLKGFKNESQVVQTLAANAPQSGMYLVTTMEKPANQAASPTVFVSINQTPMASMTRPLVIQFINQLIAAFLATWLVWQTAIKNYFGRVGFIVLFALTAGLITLIPNWNWFGFDAHYTLVEFADLLIGWLLAGLGIAAVTRRVQKQRISMLS